MHCYMMVVKTLFVVIICQKVKVIIMEKIQCSDDIQFLTFAFKRLKVNIFGHFMYLHVVMSFILCLS